MVARINPAPLKKLEEQMMAKESASSYPFQMAKKQLGIAAILGTISTDTQRSQILKSSLT